MNPKKENTIEEAFKKLKNINEYYESSRERFKEFINTLAYHRLDGFDITYFNDSTKLETLKVVPSINKIRISKYGGLIYGLTCTINIPDKQLYNVFDEVFEQDDYDEYAPRINEDYLRRGITVRARNILEPTYDESYNFLLLGDGLDDPECKIDNNSNIGIDETGEIHFDGSVTVTLIYEFVEAD